METSVSGEFVITVDRELVERSLTKKLKANSDASKFIGDDGDDDDNVRCTIFRVPPAMSGGNRSAYEPKLVSVGPYHHGTPRLKAMDDLKPRYLRKVLDRNPNLTLKDYLDPIGEREVKKAMRCYNEKITMPSEEFVEMLLLDGCFVVELLLVMFAEREKRACSPARDDDQKGDDPILRTVWMLPIIENDLLKLENQIPFFILDVILERATGNWAENHSEPSPPSLTTLLQSFFDSHLPGDVLLADVGDLEIYHILHFFHHCISPEGEQGQPEDNTSMCVKLNKFPFTLTRLIARSINRCWLSLLRREETVDHTLLTPDPESVPTAVALAEAGIHFKTKITAKSFLDVTFEGGVMEIPTLKVYDDTDALFRNLIAFEQFIPSEGLYVTAYAVLMDCLIDTASDVTLLHRKGCLVNGLGNDEDVALLFNGLCKEIAVDYDYLTDLFKRVNKHCESRWNKWRANLVHDYFTNPWAILSLLGALAVIVMTFVQTLYTVMGYYHSG